MGVVAVGDRRIQVRGLAATFWAVGVAIALSRPPTVSLAGDLTHDFYPAGAQVLAGHLHYLAPPYTTADVSTFRYPPFAAVLFAPFAAFSIRTAVVVWWGVSFLTVAATALLVSRLFTRNRALASGIAFAGLMAFAPIGTGLRDKVDPWILMLIAGAVVTLVLNSETNSARRSVLLAGFLIGISVAIKIYPVIALLLVAVAKPKLARPFLTGAVAAIAATSAIAIALIGIAPFASYARIASASSPVLTAHPIAFGALNLGARLFTSNPWTHPIVAISPGVLRDGFALLVAGVLAGLVVVVRRRSCSDSRVWSLAIVATAISSPFLEAQHLSPLALIPLLAMVDSVLSLETVLAVVVVSIGCAAAAFALPYHAAEFLSALAVVATTLHVRRRASSWEAGLAGAFVLLSTPSFVAISTFWHPPISVPKVLLGSTEFIGVLIAFAYVLMTALSSRATASFSPTSPTVVADLEFQPS